MPYKDPVKRRDYKREYARRWRAAHPERRVKENPQRHRLRTFGLTPEGLAELAAKQDGLCYLCGEPLDFSVARRVHVDHDRACCRGPKSCGTCIRGLACPHCNIGIGHFGDDPERMRRVADSLEMANRRLREIPRLQGELFSTTRGSDTAGRPGE